MEEKSVINLLENMIPFRFLPLEVKKRLAQQMTCRTFEEGEYIFEKGDRSFEVYLIEEGRVGTGVITPDRKKPLRVIRSGHYFGERSILFKQPERIFTAKALSYCTLWVLKGPDFMKLVTSDKAFALSLGNILRDKQGLFDAFDRYIAEIRQGLNSGVLDWRKMVRLYRSLQPALHPQVLNPTYIDTGALSYAVRRLPDNVTRTFSWLLTDDIPPEYRSPGDFFPKAPSPGRRRDAWEMTPGKNLVLLRHGITDLLDLVSCLCLFSVEAEKIRRRLSEPQWLAHLLKGGDLAGLPFAPEERAGLESLWKDSSPQILRNILLHNEAFTLNLRRQIENYNSRRSEKWTIQLRQATQDLLGLDPADLDDQWEVHIISSNTHSVINCLHPAIANEGDKILAWAEEVEHPLREEEWSNPSDLVYALLPDYSRARGNLFGESFEEDRGILRIRDTASTGIQVQLVNFEKLTGLAMDPDLRPLKGTGRKLIVNIDYAFGEQAEEIIRNLIMLYGRAVKSINILGKAGALVGKRGDLLIPQAFLQQDDDRYFLLPEPSSEAVTRLKRASGVGVHQGPLLTVSGTLLQNKEMLHFYRKIWGCIGLEMEGCYYSRPIRELSDVGILSKDVVERYYYYVSDLPLGEHGNLSSPLKRSEGLPPLYAITREILNQIIA